MKKNNSLSLIVCSYLKLDSFLRFNQYEILNDSGRVKAEVAKHMAEKEYERFSKTQDKEFESDFDKFVKQLREGDPLPKEDEQKKTLSSVDKDLTVLIKTPPLKTPQKYGKMMIQHRFKRFLKIKLRQPVAFTVYGIFTLLLSFVSLGFVISIIQNFFSHKREINFFTIFGLLVAIYGLLMFGFISIGYFREVFKSMKKE